MSRLPRRKSRPITIDGRRYRWLLKVWYRKYIGEAPASCDISIQEVLPRPGQTLVAELFSKSFEGREWWQPVHKASVLPRDIERIIRTGLERGWTPGKGSGSFRLSGLELTQYKVGATCPESS